ncbi:MAG: GTP-binding protein, partial [Saprospiraceae bacterium]|nr:GTP-binding protein [Saprospiraceae bacterium]
MNSNLLQKGAGKYKHNLNGTVDSLLGITRKIGHKELESTVKDILERVNDPFMFVIVGEVKAGKSSFINALLESKEEICKVAASPMTDTIQQVVYGDKQSITDINPFLKRITQPVEILKEIAIVDTPGTNTIIDHHQEITEKFIPSSDLIVFVFEAKNPYRQSSWEFFDYIKDEWKKKVIFILQQKDLINAADLETNINGVREQAMRKGITDPKVFPVSALQEQQGENELSGFIKVRSFIKENITGGRAPFLKLVNLSDTAQNINDRIYKGVILRKEQWESDLRFRNDIKETLDRQEERTQRQVRVLVENLLAGYDRITGSKKKDLLGGIGFLPMIKRTFQSTFGGADSPKEWLETLTTELESDLNKTFKDKLQDGVIDIADSIQDMAKVIDVKIKSSETILKDNHEIFAAIAEKRANILRDLQKAFEGFLKRSENFYENELLGGGEKIGPNLATGGGIAIVGIILTTIT